MKGLLSFRAKLIVTVFPVVAGVTTAALLVAERKFSQSYEQLFEQQFDGQISQLVEARERRSEALSSALQEMAALPSVVEGMKNQNLREVQHVLRPKLEQLLRERIMAEMTGGVGRGFVGGASAQGRGGAGNGKGGGPKKGGAGTGGGEGGNRAPAGRNGAGSGYRGAPQGQSSFVALIDPEGTFIRGQTELSLVPLETGIDAEESEEQLMRRDSEKLPWLGDLPFEEVLRGLEVGYFVVKIGKPASEEIREVFVMPVRDPTGGEFLGALLVGIPIAAVGERLLFERTKLGDMGEIRSGIWVEQHLLSSTIPKRYEASIAAYVGTLEKERSGELAETSVEIEGNPYRVIGRLLNPQSPFPKAAQISLYPLVKMEEEIGDLRRSVAGLGGGALLLALGLVLFVSRGLSGPIQQLMSGVEEIEKGNFGVRVPVSSNDEVGRLGAAFNDMAAGLALQEKYRSVLNAVADRTVAKQLIENQSALGGQLQDVTMLFCDIRGFTAMTENMSPAEVIDLLNHHMTAMTEVAYRHGGIVDKFVGDLIMVLFGAPFSTGDDAMKAVECAREMQVMRQHLNESATRPLEMGIGIATGDVVAGCMGSDQRLSYTVVGARVNLASRLCGVAQAGEIVLDEPTWRSVKDAVHVDPIQPLQLKGFSEPVRCYRVSRAD